MADSRTMDELVALERSAAEGAVRSSEPSIRNVECPMQDSESAVHDSESSMQNSESLVRNSESSMQNSESLVRNSESPMQNSESPFRNSESSVRNSELSVRNSELSVRNSELSVRNSESPIRNSESLVRNSEGAVRNSEGSVRNSEQLSATLSELSATPRQLSATMRQRFSTRGDPWTVGSVRKSACDAIRDTECGVTTTASTRVHAVLRTKTGIPAPGIRGRSWTNHGARPVIPHERSECRDPASRERGLHQRRDGGSRQGCALRDDGTRHCDTPRQSPERGVGAFLGLVCQSRYGVPRLPAYS